MRDGKGDKRIQKIENHTTKSQNQGISELSGRAKHIILYSLCLCVCLAGLIAINSLNKDSDNEKVLVDNANINTNDIKLDALGKVGDPPKEETNNNLTDVERQMIEEIGLDPENVNTEITQSGGKLVGEVAKTVKSYKTLADAEEEMGYYLGLHNTLESQPNLKLVGMYNIGKGSWYQALFEDETESLANITVKTSKTTSLEDLTAPYDIGDYKSVDIKSINGIDVTFGKYENDLVNLVGLATPNGKAYTIYTSVGNEYSVMESIVIELINNLKIMDDWVD